LRFGLLLALDWAVPAFPFALSFSLCFSTMTHWWPQGLVATYELTCEQLSG
jgi:hypothetical protein